ncbi:hypothetical protein DFP72DRAFT_1057244 [Ephemerocybe angulata]|uniref:Uncharacterized protein n=1 Tax=Ephemerocybe angulata TaxID=980116 RepID=A0A8H6IHZ6_9AGAR|nr:hypothetical protein DFP72DRAFT_1057244 [Tulosesus angulatus]
MSHYPYGYYGQPINPMYPPHGPPMMAPQGYQPFYPQPHPSQNIAPGPMPIGFDAEAYGPGQDYQSPPPPVSKKKSRRQSAPSGSAAQPPPLKSALKKSTNITATPMAANALEFPGYNGQGYNGNAASGYPLSRQRTNSFNRPAQERRRAGSNAAYSQDHGIDPPFQPLHMFVSFHGYNELHLENITEYALKELREIIWPLWDEGIEAQTVTTSECIVRFRNQPWNMAGPNFLMALGLIERLFTLCARRSAPRLIFGVEIPDNTSSFFLAFFNSSGSRFTLVNPPSHIDLSLGAQLKAALPRKIVTDHVEQSNLRIIEVKRKPNSNGLEVEHSLFLAHILKILNSLGFDLDASIPLLKRQNAVMSKGQEILIFKGVLPG